MNRLKKLNVFRDPLIINNQHQLRNQVISTRVFLLLFFTSLLACCLYLFLSRITISAESKSPTIKHFMRLTRRYSDTLSCPCSNLSIRHQTFLSFRPRFHEICSKEFELRIHKWIDVLFQLTQTLTNHRDFRFTAALQLRLISLLCTSVKEIISARMIDFNVTAFTSPLLITNQQLTQQVDKLMEQFIIDTKNAFKNSLQIIRIGIYASQFASGVRSNYMFTSTMSKVWLGHLLFKLDTQLYDNNGSKCNCSTSFSCTSPSKIYDEEEEQIIPGFRSGCFIFESVLASSLECFYNTTCVNQLSQKIFNTSFHHSLLYQATKFHPTNTIESMLNELMVENWTKSIDYQLYFDECQSRICSYSFLGHHSFLYIFTTILTLVGGLEYIFKILIPITVAVIRRKKSNIRNRPTKFVPVVHRLRNILSWSKMMKKIRRINLFRSQDSHSVLDIRNEFRSTRIYIVVLVICLGLIMEYFLYATTTKTNSLQHPSLKEITQSKAMSPLCRCSTNMIPYGTFVSVKAMFHPICSSNLVHHTWLNQLDKSNDSEIVQFRVSFRLLSLFCQLSQQMFDDKLRQLYNTRMISSQFLFKSELSNKVIVKIQQLISNARTTLSNSLDLFDETSKANLLLSTSEIFRPIAFFKSSFTADFGFEIYPLDNNSVSACTRSAQFANKTVNLTQFYTSCNGLERFLSSSLISFYNKTIIEQLSYFIFGNQSSFIDSLQIPHIYLMNDTIESIIRTLMIDNYTETIAYHSYYNQCRPETCVYTVTERYSFVEITWIVLGFIGGLTSLLQLIIPMIVNQLTRPKKKLVCSLSIFIEKLRRLPFYLYSKLRSLNFFKNSSTIRNEIVSTRIYSLIFLLVIIIVLFYYSLVNVTKLITVDSPTYAEFIDLNSKHNSTLVCPCSTLSIAQERFVTLSPEFHQVCSSDFISDRWIRFAGAGSGLTDVINIGFYLFSTIRTLCQLSRQAVNDRVLVFRQTHFVSREALNEQRLREEIQQLIQQSIQANEHLLSLSLQLIQDTTYGNQLISSPVTNLNTHKFEYSDRSNQFYRTIGLTNMTYGENSSCNCLTNSSCFQPAIIKNWHLIQGIIRLTGLYLGCYTLDAVLHSSLRCLYKRACVNNIISYILMINSLNTANPQLLDATRNSSYTIDSPVGELLDHLMIETWVQKISPQAHFDACQPQTCTYSVVTRHAFIVILTVLFGIIGGLNQVLQLVVPNLVRLVFKVIERRRSSLRIKPIEQ